jgi:integrase
MAKGFIRERITKAGEHRWDVVVNYRDNITGEWKRLWKTTDGSRKADTLKTKMLGEVEKPDYQKPSKMTVEAYLKEWLSGLPSTVSPRTCELYGYVCRIHLIPAFGARPLSQLRAGQIQALYSTKLTAGLSPRTCQLIHVTLHKALKNAVKTGIMQINPADSVTQVKPQRREMKTMQEDDITRFLDEAKKGDYFPLFHTYLYTGCRRSELLAVRWCDIDLLGMTMSINRSIAFIDGKVTYKAPKTASSRRLIALSPDSCVVLREHRANQDAIRAELDLKPVKMEDSDLVFCWIDTKEPLLPDSITHAWVHLVRRCGLDGIRLHDARHSHASLLLKQGVHPKVVSERLGHAGIAITMDLYSHVAPGMQQAAALGFDKAMKSKVPQTDSLDSH